MSSMKKFAVYGNCQAYALAQELLSHSEFKALYEYVPLEPCFSISEQRIVEWIQENEASLDLIISQDLKPGWRDKKSSWDISSVSKALKKRGKLLRYSDIYYRGVNPCWVYPITFPKQPHCDYFDLISLTLVAHGFESAELCVDVYNDVELLSETEIATVHAVAELDLVKRERGLDIACGHDVSALGRSKPAFFTFNHPRSETLDILAREILSQLNILPDELAADRREILSKVRLPLPKCIEAYYERQGSLTPTNVDTYVSFEDGRNLNLLDYFKVAISALKTKSQKAIREEYQQQRNNVISSVVISAINRALAGRRAISPRTLSEIGALTEKNISIDFIMNKANPQARGFMLDIIGVLRDVLLPKHMGERMTVLDLGAKTAAGSQLLASLCHPGTFSKIKLDVTSADIDSTFRQYSSATNRNVYFENRNPFEMNRTWDIVICSHVIEHVPDTMGFVQKLRDISSKYVVLAFPFCEDPGRLINGHLHSLGHDFLRKLKPSRYFVYESMFWNQSLCCIAVMEK